MSSVWLWFYRVYLSVHWKVSVHAYCSCPKGTSCPKLVIFIMIIARYGTIYMTLDLSDETAECMYSLVMHQWYKSTPGSLE